MAENMLDASNVGIAKGREGGYACVAPAGTDPTPFIDMTKTLAELCKAPSAVLKSLGYISEDGVTVTTDTDTDDKTDWSGVTIVSPMTSYSEGVEVTFLEARDTVLKTVTATRTSRQTARAPRLFATTRISPVPTCSSSTRLYPTPR